MKMIIKKEFFIKILSYLYVYLIFITPYQLHLLNIENEIFPALDIIVIFVIITHSNVSYISLFVLGLFLDYLNSSYTGMYPSILIAAQISIRYFTGKIQSLTYLLKLLLFVYFYTFITLTRSLTFNIIDSNELSITIILIQYTTTLFAYPIIYVAIEKPLKLGNSR